MRYHCVLKLMPWAAVTVVCAAVSTTTALYLHDDGDDAYFTVPVPTPVEVLVEKDVVREVKVPAAGVRELPFDAKAYSQLPIAGTFVRGVRWHDEHGDNVVLFSEVESTKRVHTSVLHAAHYADSKLVRTIKQSTECEDGDMISSFAAGYRVTDLDDDGVGELMFGVFHGACPTDVSPGQFKLFLVEDGAKYVLRGQGHYGDFYSVPEPVSREVTGAPAVFVEHLDKYWKWLSDQGKSHLLL